MGRWLAALEEGRRDTLKELVRVTPEAVDWRPAGGDNTIGTILYHIALVEADWLLADILGPDDAPAWPHDLLPFGDRDSEGRLAQVAGVPLAEHLERLAAVRRLLLDHMRPMDAEAYHALRHRDSWDVSADWVVHHLLQHEAEHRAQIAWLRDTAGGAASI
ncbi:MAG: DinB family protein [Candidatus Limnocylindria bacterium]